MPSVLGPNTYFSKSRLESMERQFYVMRQRVEGSRSPSGVVWGGARRVSGGDRISHYRIQHKALQKCFELLGDEVWEYGFKSGKRMNDIQTVLDEVRLACGYNLQYKTFRRWLTHYLQYGETPAESSRKRNSRGHTTIFTPQDDAALRQILLESPQFYLDEIAEALQQRTNKKMHHTTIWRRMKILGYSLQVAIFHARQASVEEQQMFYERLYDNVTNVQQIIIVDESHKSKNASRRRRAWGNVGRAPVLSSYFEEAFRMRYTLIAACNVAGFIPEACQIVRDENEGTVNAQRFERYTEECLVPVLGRYEFQEPNSVVLMDNASIHMSDRVVQLIHNAGALLIHTAPYSPHLNPIEYFFSTYKAALARYSSGGNHWFDAHYHALMAVKRAGARETFKHCQFPGAAEYCSTFETNIEEDELLLLLSLAAACMCVLYK